MNVSKTLLLTETDRKPCSYLSVETLTFYNLNYVALRVK